MCFGGRNSFLLSGRNEPFKRSEERRRQPNQTIGERRQQRRKRDCGFGGGKGGGGGMEVVGVKEARKGSKADDGMPALRLSK